MDATVLLERANLLLEQGRYRDAEKQVKQVLEQEPQNDNALSVLARCYLNSGEHDKGIEIIQQAISIDPEESFYYYLLGFGYYHKDMPLPAADYLNKAIELNPYNAEYFGLLAHVLLDEKQYEEALLKANEGLALDPENITCLNTRSRVLTKLKRVDEAMDTIEGSLSKDPDNEYTHATIGWNYLERGNHKKANHHFREALRISPNYESARMGLKESLKSNFFPYKIVVLFNLWMSEKTKSFRWAFLIGIYILFRIVSAAAKNDTLKPFLLPLILLYCLFIAFTWIANPLANFFLLFHRDGKYSLTKSESTGGILVVTALLSGILLGSYAYYWFPEPRENILSPAIVLATMAVPIGQMEFPLDFKSGSIRVWYPFGLVILGLLAIILGIMNSEIGIFLLVIYAVALFIFLWVANSWG
jgi:tetratricopeptide (TPR) repeat protein